MRRIITKISFLALFSGLILASCSKDIDAVETVELNAVSAKASGSIDLPENLKGNIQLNGSELMVRDFEHINRVNVVTPSECGPTPFQDVYFKYDDLLFNDFLANYTGNLDGYYVIYSDFFAINQIAARFENKNTDYFGANGEYTAYVNNRVRSLEKFWDMADLIEVNGQHSSTLEDIDFIRYVYENYTTLPDFYIEYLLEFAVYYNNVSDQIPENPIFALDGFATFDRKIVIGDGIVSMMAETGLDPKVVWSSILAHEWAHQMQFLNYGGWGYPVPPFIGTPESTRMTELEADFITGFYLTHKRGATYNWKRVEDALSAFYNIGDCGFTSDGHHGTPLQRLEAARLGFELAQGAKKNGHILSQDQVHNSFIAVLNSIVGEPASEGETPPAYQ